MQIGVGRAGWYSYDWLDNLGRPSAERIKHQAERLALSSLPVAV